MRIRTDRPTLNVSILLLAAVAALGCGDAPAAGTSVAARPPAPATPATLTKLRTGPAIVYAVGDASDTGAGTARLARAVVRSRPDLLLYLGDVYETGTSAEFRTYDSLYGRLARRTAPTPGNHEFPKRDEGYLPYWESRTGAPLPDYYAFRIAGWTLLSLNSESEHDENSAQLKWLKRQLTAPGNCRIAFRHRQRFSAGRHGDQTDVAPLWDALRGHVRLVLSGHDHNSQRFKPVGGVTQFVIGAGGHTLYPLSSDTRLAFGDDRAPAALRIALTPGRAELTIRRASGAVIDRSAVRCRPR